MTRDEMICLMVKANAVEGIEEDGSMFVEFSEQQLKTFTALVAAAEREACAKLCDELRDEDGFEPYGTECAAAIRARGDE